MNEPVYSVLVSDDVAALRRLIKLSLQTSGRFHVVAEAPNGAAAVASANEHHPDLVLLDLSMPEMDGLEALPQIIRASPESRVVVFSGFNHVRMAPVALRLGASAYVEKGLEPELLVKRLLSVLEAPPGDGAGAETPPGGKELPPNPPKPEGNAQAAPGSASPERLLFLTDSSELVERARRATTQASFKHVRTLEAALEQLQDSNVDLVLADLREADPEARNNLIELLSHAPRTPVVLLVDSPDSDLAALGFKLGVEDCLPRNDIDPRLLRRSLLYAIERRRGHEARQVARQQALEVRRIKEVEALKTQFFNSAAHELNTPLTPIKLQLHLLKSAEQEFKPEHRRSLQILDRSVDRLARLTQDLLDVARLQAGRLRLDPQWVDLNGLTREVAETFEAVAMAQGVQLETRLDKSTLVHADPKGLTQVLYNLISNAIKFTGRGGRVDVESIETGTEATVLVHDTGIGFTSEQAAHLFQPFSRAHEEVSPGMSGTGLGLYVAKGVVELHGGRIWCESPGPGRGSTFAFTIPVSKPNELAAAGQPMGLRGPRVEAPIGANPA